MVPEPDEGRASDLLQRAIELSGLSEYATAAETAARAIELDPNNAFAHTVRAWALENLGEQHLDEARSVYERAIALDATAPWPRTGLADLLYRAGSREEAERLYRRVAEDAEPFDERLACLEFRGWSLYRLGRLDEAIRTFHISIERLPGRISVLFDLALTLLANGQPDEAGDAYETAFEAVADADPRRRRAPLAVAAEDLEEAISSHPLIGDLPPTTKIRERLRLELRALGPPGDRPSGGPASAS